MDSAKQLAENYIAELNSKLTKIAATWPELIKFDPEFTIRSLVGESHTNTVNETVAAIACQVSEYPDTVDDVDDMWSAYDNAMASLPVVEDEERGSALSKVVKAFSQVYKKFKKPLTKQDLMMAIARENPAWAKDKGVVDAVKDAVRAHGVEVLGD